MNEKFEFKIEEGENGPYIKITGLYIPSPYEEIEETEESDLSDHQTLNIPSAINYKGEDYPVKDVDALFLKVFSERHTIIIHDGDNDFYYNPNDYPLGTNPFSLQMEKGEIPSSCEIGIAYNYSAQKPYAFMTNLQFNSIESNDNTLEISPDGYKAKAANGRLIEVDTLGKGAIQELPDNKIDEIIIGNGIRNIQYHSVSNSKVKTITLSESVEYLNPMAFAECNELTTINLPNQSPLYSNWNKREFISQFAFNNPNVTINITENGKVNEQIRCNGKFVYSVSNGEVALLSCPYSTGELRLPEEIEGCPVTRIESYFLEHNENVEKVIIPSTVTEIGHRAFFYCKSLNTVGVEGIAEGECIIPESVKNIGYRSFAGCNFDSCVISSSVNVDESAFDHCEHLTTVTITNPDVKFGEEAFEGSENLTSIRLPKSWESKGKEALEAIGLDLSNPNLKITYGDQGQDQTQNEVSLNDVKIDKIDKPDIKACDLGGKRPKSSVKSRKC